MTTVFASATRKLGALLIVTAVASGCGIDKQTAPSVVGPSGHALSLTIFASPDILPRDGEAVSNIRLVVHDADGQPKTGQRLTLFASTGKLSAGEVVTGAGGEARVTFVAPALDVYVSEAVVSAVPVGDNFANSMTRNVTIALLGPPPPTIPDAPVAKFTIVTASPEPGKDVAFDATESTVGAGATIDRYFWTFGDDTIADTAISATVKRGGYDTGTYVVTLTITDSRGRQDTAVKTIEVKPE